MGTEDVGSRKKRKLVDNSDKNEPEIFLISDEDEEDDRDLRITRSSQTKRAASAAPASKVPEVALGHRASSHEPPGSQEMQPKYGALTTDPIGSASHGPAGSSTEKQGRQLKGQSNQETLGSVRATAPERFTEQHVCPICSKTLQTDNAGLNAHIDFCLSRSAILAASASAGNEKKPQSSSKKPSSSKPSSKRGTQKTAGPDIRSAWKFAS